MFKTLSTLIVNIIHYLFLKISRRGVSRLKSKKFSILIIAPHQDDETIGAGGKIIQTIKEGGNVYVVYVTTSVPKNVLKILGIRKVLEFNRKIEAKIAMLMAGVPEENLIFLDYGSNILEGYDTYPNPELIQTIDGIRNDLQNIIDEKAPDEIYIPAYEGGHCDHDIINYIMSKTVKGIPIYEMPFYPTNYPHYKKGPKFSVFQEFIPSKKQQSHLPRIKVIRLKMTEKEKQLKDKMLKIYRSQNSFLIQYWNKTDKFRMLPRYNYLLPPHKGELYTSGTLILDTTFNDFKAIVKYYEKKGVKAS